MDRLARSPAEGRHDRRLDRRAARLSACALGICSLMAMWQDRAIAPAVQDGMVTMADAATTFLAQSETSGVATAISHFGGGGLTAATFGPITDAWLWARN